MSSARGWDRIGCCGGGRLHVMMGQAAEEHKDRKLLN